MTRALIVVDLETTGLHPDRHIIVEVAWWNLATDKRGHFIPPHDVDRALAFGDPKALELNGYRERIIGKPQRNGYHELLEELHSNTLAGSNPTFDAGFLQWATGITTWHHRLADLSAYAAGALGFSPGELPGLADVCKRVNVLHEAAHTAEADVTATGECFREIIRHRRISCTPDVGVHVEPHRRCPLA